MEELSGNKFSRFARANLKKVLFASVVASVVGAHLGQPVLVFGHVALIVALIFSFCSESKPAKFTLEVRASVWCISILTLTWALSIVVHWEDYARPLSVLKKLRYLILPILCILLFRIRILLIRNSATYARAGLIGLAIAISIASLAGLIGYWTGFHPLRFGSPPDPNRVSGMHGNAMTFGYSMPLAILLLLGAVLLHFSRRFSWKLSKGDLQLMIAAIVIGIIGLYFSFTRGGAVGLLVGGAFLLLTTRAWKLLAWLSGAAVVVLIVAFMTNARFVKDVSRSNLERLSQWRVATLASLKYPTIGVGYRQLEQNGDKLKEELRLPKDKWETIDGTEVASHFISHAHNNFLEAFASGGVLAGLAFLGFCISWARETWASGLGRVLFLPSVAAFIVSGFFECTFLDGEVLTMIMLLYVASQVTADVEAEAAAGVPHSAS